MIDAEENKCLLIVGLFDVWMGVCHGNEYMNTVGHLDSMWFFPSSHVCVRDKALTKVKHRFNETVMLAKGLL